MSGLCIRSEIKRAPDTGPEYEGAFGLNHLKLREFFNKLGTLN